MSEPVIYEIQEGVALLTINRPKARNALNWEAQRLFADKVALVAADATSRVLVITGAGEKAFASGGDMKELLMHPDREDAMRLSRTMGDALARLTMLNIPVIAALNGDAVGGGCEILTACDLRVAAEDARFRFAQVQVGVTTGWGGSARLIHLIGAARAMELMLTGSQFEADDALAMGLIHRLAKRDEVLDSALRWAKELTMLPRDALASIKRLSWAAADMTLAEAYHLERQLFADLWPSQDHLEALAAFNEKRRPRFGGL